MTQLDRFIGLLDRLESMPDDARHALWPSACERFPVVDSEMVELEETMSTKRDWLDTHRTHGSYEHRREAFFSGDVRRHAEYGEAIERYWRLLTGGATYRWPDNTGEVGAGSAEDQTGTPVPDVDLHLSGGDSNDGDEPDRFVVTVASVPRTDDGAAGSFLKTRFGAGDSVGGRDGSVNLSVQSGAG